MIGLSFLLESIGEFGLTILWIDNFAKVNTYPPDSYLSRRKAFSVFHPLNDRRLLMISRVQPIGGKLFKILNVS